MELLDVVDELLFSSSPRVRMCCFGPSELFCLLHCDLLRSGRLLVCSFFMSRSAFRKSGYSFASSRKLHSNAKSDIEHVDSEVDGEYR